jgi:hypothetical protein
MKWANGEFSMLSLCNFDALCNSQLHVRTARCVDTSGRHPRHREPRQTQREAKVLGIEDQETKLSTRFRVSAGDTRSSHPVKSTKLHTTFSLIWLTISYRPES